MLRSRSILAPALLVALSLSAPSGALATPPAAPVRDVVDVHWGVKVDDPYRDLEKLDDPRSRDG
jgi:hypothetical protein